MIVKLDGVKVRREVLDQFLFGAVLVFQAVLASAPREACMQIGTCKGANDALTEGGLEDSKSFPVLGFPCESARFWEARTLRNCKEALAEAEVP